MMRTQSTLLLALLALLPLGACGDASSSTSPSGGGAGAGSTAGRMPSGLWSDTPLAGAKDVIAVRESGKDGDTVVLRGTLQDFGDMATFRLVEDSLRDCTETGPEDNCVTPWDYCCEDPEKLARLTVNVEFLDGDLPGEWTLRGEHGLDRLSDVTVAGTLRIDEVGNLRLEATHVGPQ